MSTLSNRAPERTPVSGTDLADRLRTAVAGRVFVRGEEGYRLSAAGFNLATDHRSAAVVVATSAADVAAAVGVADAAGSTVAVQATGHGAYPAPENSILIDTALLDTITIDRDAATASVGAGVRWQQVLDAAAPHGLAGLAGSSTTVGVIGYTLGGGLGPLARRYGFAADHVLRMEVVTADGQLRRVTPDVEPDLFWALLGGGAAFGIVTQMTFRLFPIRSVYGGGIFYDIAHAPTVLRAWRDWITTAPEEVTSSIAVMNLPPAPDVPEPLCGRCVVHLRYAHTAGVDADPVAGAAALGAMRQIAPAIIDAVGELPYAALASIHNDPTEPMPVADRSIQLREFPDSAIDALLAVAGPVGGLPIAFAEIRAMAGALGREPEAPNAVGGRSGAFNLTTVGVLAPPIADLVPGAVDAVVDALAEWGTGGALANFAGAVAATGVLSTWSPRQRHRLIELRHRLDPQGIFDPAARWPRPHNAIAEQV